MEWSDFSANGQHMGGQKPLSRRAGEGFWGEGTRGETAIPPLVSAPGERGFWPAVYGSRQTKAMHLPGLTQSLSARHFCPSVLF